MNESTQKKENPIKWLFRYLRESREELSKVTWPTRKETITYALAVIGTCVLFAIFFAVLDLGLTKGLEALI